MAGNTHILDNEELLGLVTQHGERVDVSGNNPFLIDDPNHLWVVTEGRVEIFVVAVDDHQPAGARTHFVTRDPGECLFGMDLDTYGMGSGYLAVGVIGTVVYKIPVETFRSWSGDAGVAPLMAEMIDDWIHTLSKRLTQDIVPHPIARANLTPHKEAYIPGNVTIRSAREVLWLMVPPAAGLFIDMEELMALEGDVQFPLTPQTWLRSAERFFAAPKQTIEIIADDELWRGIQYFHEVLCTCEFLNKRLNLVDEINRLSSKADYAGKAREAALHGLADVMRTSGHEQAYGMFDEVSSDKLIEVCRLVGDAMGLNIKPFPELQTQVEMGALDKIMAVAQSSQCRVRNVLLAPGWHSQDSGPMVGLLEDSEEPVALIPISARRYEAVIPSQQKRIEVDREFADTLKPFGVSFYRPFPDGKLGVSELLKFAARGVGADISIVGIMAVITGLFGALTPIFIGQIFDGVIPESGPLDDVHLNPLVVSASTMS